MRVDLADRASRAAAVIVDLLIILAILVVVTLVFTFVFRGLAINNWIVPFVLLVSFAARNFYFIVFELHWHGITPGKRVFGLRVIDRAGGRLGSDAIFARNLMREVELFIPLSLFVSSGQIGSEAWVVLLLLVWTSVFTLMPFFNRDRLRVGDIVGGTWVIFAPKAVLLPDMAESVTGESAHHRPSRFDYEFSDEQLSAYGIYELHTLEGVLRRKGPGSRATQEAVCKSIQRKIEWRSADRVDSQRFLEAFYAALRSRLESRLVLGERRESKHDPD